LFLFRFVKQSAQNLISQSRKDVKYRYEKGFSQTNINLAKAFSQLNLTSPAKTGVYSKKNFATSRLCEIIIQNKK
jgi:hypothetical protein